MELEDKEMLVQKELTCLLLQHSVTEIVSADDEIVLSYVLGILESLTPGEDIDETEDVEPFAEMMEAYLPGFAAISMPAVGEWMLSTARKLSQPLESESNGRLDQQEERQQCETRDAEDTPLSSSLPTLSRHECPPSKPRHSSLSEEALGACGEKRVLQLQTADSDSITALRELCPAACTAELQHCLHTCEGNMEEAARLLFHRQESGTAIKASETKSRKKPSRNGCSLQNDESVKDSILAKYSFVDTSEDKTEHRPELFQKEQKKMIRYREGQVVSTKGERFSEIKKQESEDMKKTYVSLKPQKKYRFH